MSQSIPPSNSNQTRDVLWNFLSALIVVGMIAVLIVIALIYVNPRSPLNPFPLPTPIPALALTQPPLFTAPPPAASATPPVSQSTRTTAPTQPSLPTPTAILATPVAPSGSSSPTPTFKPSSGYAFIPQSEPKAIDAALFSPGRGCQWMGVAGQAFDIKGSPVPLGIEIRLAGILDGKPILTTSLTGTAVTYGPSGFEFFLSEKPIASKNSLWIQLLDQSGLPLSDRVYFDTFADCSKNLVIINFKQVR